MSLALIYEVFKLVEHGIFRAWNAADAAQGRRGTRHERVPANPHLVNAQRSADAISHELDKVGRQRLVTHVIHGGGPFAVRVSTENIGKPQAQKRQHRMSISPAQCRAARSLLEITQPHLAEMAGFGLSTIVDFEKQRRKVSVEAVAAIKTALETAGVIFIDQNGAGAGVRLRDKS
ncbi:helix-turn-helix domain-containing protein [Rhizobium sp. GN54]|uniref:helix-turn-helix domain-containing protein n=1 Tax=Rhizobium sp. GN54 TaxID=2898150 RepID=UPI001E323D09|nr:helix-turn-helix transcriptional regulator [Rhizobium sp. GN54]MCD2183501.1 helix-turn-helix domain-containing protein [Rhizobium sp. GN54]